MTTQDPFTIQDFLTPLKIIIDNAAKPPEPREDPVFLRILRSHFGTEPTHLPTVKEAFEKADHPNLHLAVIDLLAREGWRADLHGFVPPNEHMGVKFSTLLGDHYGNETKQGPVEYCNIPLHDDRVLTCVQAGLYLIHHGEQPLALLVRGPMSWNQSGVEVEIMALDQADSEHFLAELRSTIRANNVYRSHVISLIHGGHGTLEVRFHRLPAIERGGIILPQGVLERVERQTISFARQREKLKAMGRHIKRGLLLYGPPGTFQKA